MPATFSWEREWLREASLHELSARALCDVALPGVAAAKQHFVTTTKSPTSPRSPPIVVKPVTLQFSTRRPLDFGAAARAGRSPANDAQALQRQLAAAGLSPGRLHMLRRAAGSGSPRGARAPPTPTSPTRSASTPLGRPPSHAKADRLRTCLSGTPLSLSDRPPPVPLPEGASVLIRQVEAGHALRADELAALRAVPDAIAAAAAAAAARRRRPASPSPPTPNPRPASFALSLSPPTPSPPPSRPPRKPRSPPKTPAASPWHVEAVSGGRRPVAAPSQPAPDGGGYSWVQTGEAAASALLDAAVS